MLLDEPRKNEARVPLPVRVPKSLKKSIEKRAGEARGGVTSLIVNALELDRVLAERLTEHKIRLQRYALDQSLDWSTQAPEAYARLILGGLEAAENNRK